MNAIGREILLRIVFDLLVQDRLDHESRACEQQRVAIGRRDRGRLGANRRAAAGLVVDDDRLAKLALQLLRQQPHHDVIRRPRRVGHDDPDRLARKALGNRPLRSAGQRQRRQGGNNCKSGEHELGHFGLASILVGT